MSEENEINRGRRQKAARLREQGLDPYPARAGDRLPLAEVRRQASKLKDGAVSVAGRILTIRGHGGALFMTIRDGSGELQLYFRQDELTDRFETVTDLLDAGDLIWATGRLFDTKRAELTVDVTDFAILAKAERPLPEKWHGLKDTEKRYRQRYLDLLSNPESHDRFQKRTRIISATRQFLDARGFLEVETPILQPIYGGALAKPFTTHHDRLDLPLYLRIADELYLKRLIVGGLDRVYEIGHDFRNEGLDTSHNTEFTMLEAYWAYASYLEMMELTEELISGLAQSLLGTTRLTYQGQGVDLQPPWERLTVHQATSAHAGIDLAKAPDLESLVAVIQAKGLKLNHQPTWAKLVDQLLKTCVRPRLAQPTFLTDYPVEMSPLAKRKEGSDGLVERFQPIIAGLELGNAYSELNDPVEQRARFEQQAQARAAGDDEAQVVDEDFLTALEHGMPPTAGLGIGIDRLVMLLTDTPSIRDVILFPQLRTEGAPSTKAVDNSPGKA